jgi:ATP-dependent DNA helicase DinG
VRLDDALIQGTDTDVIQAYASYAERARTERFGLYEDDVIVLDVETTGFDPSTEEIIEIAAARMNGPEVLDRFSTYVNPHRVVPDEIVRLTGIGNEQVADAPDIFDVLDALVEFCGSCDIVAHNAPFDQSFVMRDLDEDRLPGRWIDTLALSRIVLPRFKNHRLKTLASAFDALASSHRATDDVEALCGVWRVLLVATSDLPEGLAELFASLHPEVDWPLRSVFQRFALEQGETRFSLAECRDRRVQRLASKGDGQVGGQVNVVEKTEADGDSHLFPSREEICAAFAPDGVVASMYSSYEQRQQQVDMAGEVVDAFSTNTHRVIEAGTGVGKSMAYLLPAALCAKRANISIGVATKTNALMDQLVYHELPRLSGTLPGGLSYVALKGYEHYPCLRKLERAARQQGGYAADDRQRQCDELMVIAMLYTYAAQTTWGDIDALSIPWRVMPRSRICAVPGECTYTHCHFFPHRCFLHGARQLAKRADIVVTNHALLFCDVMFGGGILPPIKYWIVDEAHSVEDEARKQLSVSVDAEGMLAALDQLAGEHGSIVGSIRRRASKHDGAAPILAQAATLEAEAMQTRSAAISFFQGIKGLDALTKPSSYDQTDLWIDDSVRASAPWMTLEHVGRALLSHLETLSMRCHDLLDLLEASEDGLAEQRANLVSMSDRIVAMRLALKICLDGSDDSFVYSACVNRRDNLRGDALKAARLDVGQSLAEEFYPRVLSVVYTSATIATGTSFEHFAHTSGLDRLDDDQWSALRLESSYEFERNMTIYVPTDMPDPRENGYSQSLERLLLDIHRALGGSVLTLFTNRREMERAYQHLMPLLEAEDMRLLCQRRGTSVRNLRDEFLDDKNASMFALRSFWDGFDAPGETLRCVIVTRLPFGRPNDPLSCERNRRERRTAWSRYSLPEAILSLKQASGRLIRTSTDSGFFVVADSRLVSKPYGKAFLEALPSSHQLLLPMAEIAPSMERNM